MGTALLSGGLLAFALSFDEIIVTNFTAGAGTQTIPMWILSAIQRPAELPVVNVVALVLIVLSVIPVWLATRISGESDGGRPGLTAGATSAGRGPRSRPIAASIGSAARAWSDRSGARPPGRHRVVSSPGRPGVADPLARSRPRSARSTMRTRSIAGARLSAAYPGLTRR